MSDFDVIIRNVDAVRQISLMKPPPVRHRDSRRRHCRGVARPNSL